MFLNRVSLIASTWVLSIFIPLRYLDPSCAAPNRNFSCAPNPFSNEMEEDFTALSILLAAPCRILSTSLSKIENERLPSAPMPTFDSRIPPKVSSEAPFTSAIKLFRQQSKSSTKDFLETSNSLDKLSFSKAMSLPASSAFGKDFSNGLIV